MRPRSSPDFATRAIIASSAATHSSGDETATAGSLPGRTPCFVPYSGNASSNDNESSKTTRRTSSSIWTTSAERLCVLESRPR